MISRSGSKLKVHFTDLICIHIHSGTSDNSDLSGYMVWWKLPLKLYLSKGNYVVQSINSWTFISAVQSHIQCHLQVLFRIRTTHGWTHHSKQGTTVARKLLCETYFNLVYPQTCLFSHYPKYMTLGQYKECRSSTNQKTHYSALLFSNTTTSLLMPHRLTCWSFLLHLRQGLSTDPERASSIFQSIAIPATSHKPPQSKFALLVWWSPHDHIIYKKTAENFCPWTCWTEPVARGSPAGVQHALRTKLTYSRWSKPDAFCDHIRTKQPITESHGPKTPWEPAQDTTGDTVLTPSPNPLSTGDWLENLQ